jgi:hypothetical protein
VVTDTPNAAAIALPSSRPRRCCQYSMACCRSVDEQRRRNRR